MPKINVLSESLANKIAAGEVVERPASVVKELVENAVDAGSQRIFVSLLEGGTRLIQVEDDGEGMEQEDACLAFQRHATSKVAVVEDLSSIKTLGFRGEALPSIASISNIRLRTRTVEALEGSDLSLEAGKIKSVKAAVLARGSNFEIRDLFFNVPARKKFLKSTQTELSHISGMLFQIALSYPSIHFRLMHGNKRLLDCPRVPDPKSRILQLIGRKPVESCLQAEGEDLAGEGLSIQAFFSRPPLLKNYRKDQYLFVNQRPVRSPLLVHAIYDAYASYLMKGEHPFFVLFLEIDPTRVDVNVHPAKREVRFQNTDLVHQTVRRVFREALSSAGGIGLGEDVSLPSEGPEAVSSVSSHPKWSGREEGIRGAKGLPSDSRGSGEAWLGWPKPSGSQSASETVKESEEGYVESSSLFPKPSFSIQTSSLGSKKLIRPLGQIYGTFLLAEVEGCLVIIDQHTAHERVLYESLLAGWRRFRASKGQADAACSVFIEVQPLLFPQQVDLPASRVGILKDYLMHLEEVGLKIEPFGETTFLVRAVPALLTEMNLESFLVDLTEELSEIEVSSQVDQPMLKMIASMACHGAVRAHQTLALPEIESLLKEYFEKDTPPTCPHGRPILLSYPLIELEKLFRRR
ncbi:MAG: DNA mismatch repair endonuclease MutL [Nitrospiria bacterium]